MIEKEKYQKFEIKHKKRKTNTERIKKCVKYFKDANSLCYRLRNLRVEKYLNVIRDRGETRNNLCIGTSVPIGGSGRTSNSRFKSHVLTARGGVEFSCMSVNTFRAAVDD